MWWTAKKQGIPVFQTGLGGVTALIPGAHWTPPVGGRVSPNIQVYFLVGARQTFERVEEIEVAIEPAEMLQGQRGDHHAAAQPHAAFDEGSGDPGIHDILRCFVKREHPLARRHREAAALLEDGQKRRVQIRCAGPRMVIRRGGLMIDGPLSR